MSVGDTERHTAEKQHLFDILWTRFPLRLSD
jgi:hypothetical protein